MNDFRRTAGALGVVAASLVSCGGGGGSSSTTVTTSAVSASAILDTTVPATAATPGDGSPTGPAGWTADTSSCVDPARAEKPIEGEVRIGSAMPLSGGPAAAFKPVKDGFELYINYADAQGLLPGYALSADIRDDQYDGTQTPGVVDGLIDDGVDLFAGIIGAPNNLAVRDSLNDACIPQLLALNGSPAWGEAADYPWTTGALVPYDIESWVYATKLSELQPNAQVAIFYVNNDFGKAYVDAFKAKADELGLVIVDEQAVEPDAYDPPTAQVGSIAGHLPDAIVAVPLGLQCPAFLTELGTAQALNQGWDPKVFVTNTCASKLFFGLAGPAADGIYSSNNLLDSNDPKTASQPGVKTFLDAFAAAGLADDPAMTEAGWNVGEVTVAILDEALKSGTLTRKSIIEAARNMTYTPTLARPAIQYEMNGVDDAYAFQTLQVLQWNVESQTFTEIGEPISDFES
ncbi:MAG TPA: ABC transporter substrate-binding protein [Ilumatobacteraceae bacterium]|nr:ABC transporter substrate-binding protein [Ilumatobacteraceae bacterium]